MEICIQAIYTQHTPEEYTTIVCEFNNSITNIQVLVTNIRLSSVGFDFHGACCKDIVFGWPWNANLMNQVLDRLICIY